MSGYTQEEIEAFRLGDELVHAAVDWHAKAGLDQESTNRLHYAVALFMAAIPEKWKRESALDARVDVIVKGALGRS